MNKIFLLLTLLTFCFINSYGNYDFNPNCKKAYSDILDLKFSEANNILASEKALNPDNDIPYYLDDYIDMLTILIGDNKTDFKRIKPNKESRIDRLEKGDSESPWYRYCLAEVYIHWAFIHVKYKEYMTAMYDFTKAYRMLEKNSKEFPGFLENKKELGLLHILIGAMPDEYRGLTKMLNMHGDLNDGTAELEEVMNASMTNPQYEYLKTESLYLLTFVYIVFWHDIEKMQRISELYEGLRGDDKEISPLKLYAMAKLAITECNNDRAIELLLNKPDNNAYFKFVYLDYLLGLTKLNRLDNDADKYFQNFINNCNGNDYLKTSEQKLAWYYLLKGDTVKYIEHMADVEKMGDNAIDEDEQAEIEAEKNDVPNVSLLKGRLLCDGGYFEKCIDLINDKKAIDSYKSYRDFLEFSYRLGRAYHEWGKPEQAIPYYELTIKNGANSELYFAANSSLNLGYIYEKQHDYEKARYYYRMCLSMKNAEYKNSIRQKAKSGLRRIG